MKENRSEQGKFKEGHKISCTSLRAWDVLDSPLLDAWGWISQEII